MADTRDATRRSSGVYHHHSDEDLKRFRAISTQAKLEWLQAMREILWRYQSPRQREIMNRFRRGEL